jgi:hypothetical protein
MFNVQYFNSYFRRKSMGLLNAIKSAANTTIPGLGNSVADMGRGVKDFAVDRATAARDALDTAVNYVKENPRQVALGVGGVGGVGALGLGGMAAANAIGDTSREVFNPYSGYDDGIQGMKDSQQQLGEIYESQARMNDLNAGVAKDISEFQRGLGRDTMDQAAYIDLAKDKQRLKAEEAANVLNNATQQNQTAGQILASAMANDWIK